MLARMPSFNLSSFISPIRSATYAKYAFHRGSPSFLNSSCLCLSFLASSSGRIWPNSSSCNGGSSPTFPLAKGISFKWSNLFPSWLLGGFEGSSVGFGGPKNRLIGSVLTRACCSRLLNATGGSDHCRGRYAWLECPSESRNQRSPHFQGSEIG